VFIAGPGRTIDDDAPPRPKPQEEMAEVVDLSTSASSIG
jgi:hypothetical protein